MNKPLFNLASLLGVLPIVISCSGPSAPANTGTGAVPVNVYEVKQEEATSTDLYPGTVVATNEVQLRSEVNGYITGIFFTEGEKVRKGQRLYEIERDRYAAAYNQAKASLEMARANLDKARKDAQRYTNLHAQNAVAKQRYDYALTDLANAEQQVAASEAQLSLAATDLRHAVITAPFDGTIGISRVKRGAIVTAGQTELNTVSSNDPIAVDFVVSEKEMGRFIGFKRQPAPETDSLFTIRLPDNTRHPAPGRITLIDRAVDPQTGTLRVRLAFANPSGTLKAGMSCNLQVRNVLPQKQVLAPFKAVTEQMGEYFVYTVEGDTARQQQVVLGARIGDKVIVSSGLQPGEQVVVEGIQKLRDRTRVQLDRPRQSAVENPSSPRQTASR